MKYQTVLLRVDTQVLQDIRSWCLTQLDLDSWYIQDVGVFHRLPVIRIHFVHAHDLMQFELTWNNLF